MSSLGSLASTSVYPSKTGSISLTIRVLSCPTQTGPLPGLLSSQALAVLETLTNGLYSTHLCLGGILVVSTVLRVIHVISESSCTVEFQMTGPQFGVDPNTRALPVWGRGKRCGRPPSDLRALLSHRAAASTPGNRLPVSGVLDCSHSRQHRARVPQLSTSSPEVIPVRVQQCSWWVQSAFHSPSDLLTLLLCPMHCQYQPH